MSAAEFRQHCLRVMDEVSETRQAVVITKRGRPVVQIVPVREHEKARNLEGTILHEDDDIFSTGEAWDANEPPRS
jgi:prevent-host-death family protein